MSMGTGSKALSGWPSTVQALKSTRPKSASGSTLDVVRRRLGDDLGGDALRSSERLRGGKGVLAVVWSVSVRVKLVPNATLAVSTSPA